MAKRYRSKKSSSCGCAPKGKRARGRRHGRRRASRGMLGLGNLFGFL